MHELGMVTGVVESVRQAAEANHADKVLKVSLSVGEMTEAIEDALTFAYEAITDNDPLFSGSKLDITMVLPGEGSRMRWFCRPHRRQGTANRFDRSRYSRRKRRVKKSPRVFLGAILHGAHEWRP